MLWAAGHYWTFVSMTAEDAFFLLTFASGLCAGAIMRGL
jgi:hypothetical protein